VQPGRPLTVGIRLEMEKGWHTYWRNPGDSGLATRVRWQLPAGFTAGELRWPYPTAFASGPLVSYGYEHEVLLPVELSVPSSVGQAEVRIAARVDWLECQEACLPGRADVSLVLPVRQAARPGPDAALFAEARRRLPARDPTWRVTARRAPSLALLVRPPRGTELREAHFYPALAGALDNARRQALAREGSAYRLTLPPDPAGALGARLAGVLVAGTGSGTVALDVDVPLAAQPVRTSRTQERKP
jgi:DsbC/DsbD-like thiol-disulfide interchange protein